MAPDLSQMPLSKLRALLSDANQTPMTPSLAKARAAVVREIEGRKGEAA